VLHNFCCVMLILSVLSTIFKLCTITEQTPARVFIQRTQMPYSAK
jgi:hypothetical protein